jgi:hypothetical protein
MRVKPGGLLVALWCGVALAAPADKVTEVQRLFDDLEVEAASKAADAALAQGGLDRASFIRLSALQGLARATLNRAVPARDAFYRVLLLEPGYTLPKNQPPRVKTPFFEAKGMAAENGPLAVEPAFTEAEGTVTGLTVTVQRDVLKLARAAVFTVDVDGAQRQERVELAGGLATLAVSGRRVRWSVVVLADKDNVLLEAGTSAAPLEAVAAARPAVVAEPPPAVTTTAPTPRAAWKRPVGFALLGAGAAAGVVGAVFGARSGELRGQLRDAARTDEGVVTGLTQREAFALDRQAQDSALAANVLFISAGVVAAAGLGLVLWSLGDPVTVAPSAGGVVVSGTF